MHKSSTGLAALAVLVLSGLAILLPATPVTTAALSATGPGPTYSKDVAPIINKHCAGCHRPGEIAPMSLLTYEDVRPWARAIREQVAQGTMPPWHASAPRGTFSNDRRLSDDERDTMIRWVDAGALRGDPRDLPPSPRFTEGWEIGTPDVVLSMPSEFNVPASGTVPYQYFQVPTNFKEDKWIQAVEVKPGARSVVHHVLVFCRESGATRPAGFVQITPRMSAFGNGHGHEDSHAAQHPRGPGALLGTTAPGTNAMIFKPGTAILVRAGAVLLFQIHYTASGVATRDRSSVGLIFAKQPPEQEIRNSAFVNPMFVIPAGAPNAQVESAIQFDEDSHIWALFPHTHLRGKSWEYRLVYPDGRSETVLSVPKYDFNWQTYYVFSHPLAVPKGTRLEATARYDNSAGNRWNPDPGVDVRWGEQTWQEMQYSGITFTIDNQRRDSARSGSAER
jgi:hypothetical protein